MSKIVSLEKKLHIENNYIRNLKFIYANIK